MNRLQRAWIWLMNQIKMISELEPAAVRGAIVALVAILGTVGVHVTPGVPDAIVNIVTAAVTISAFIASIWARRSVTPNSKVVVVAPDPIAYPRMVEAGEAVTRASDTAILDAARSAPTVAASE